MTCPTCHGEVRILHFYARGPGDAPGNMLVGCPDCQAGCEYNRRLKAEMRNCMQMASSNTEAWPAVYALIATLEVK